MSSYICVYPIVLLLLTTNGMDYVLGCFPCCTKKQDNDSAAFTNNEFEMDSISPNVDFTLRALARKRAKKHALAATFNESLNFTSHQTFGIIRNPLTTPKRIYNRTKQSALTTPAMLSHISVISGSSSKESGFTIDSQAAESDSGSSFDHPSCFSQNNSTKAMSEWTISNTNSTPPTLSDWAMYPGRIVSNASSHANVSLFAPKALSVGTGSIKSTDVLSQHFKKMQRRKNYNWTHFAFDSLPIAEDKYTRISLLIAMHLETGRMLDAQITECLQFQRDSKRLLEYTKIRQLFFDIPALYKQKSFDVITQRIKESSEHFAAIMAFFSKTKVNNNTAVSTPQRQRTFRFKVMKHSPPLDQIEPKESKPAFRFRVIKHTQNVDAVSPLDRALNVEAERDPDRELYNKQIRKANFSEDALDDHWRTGKNAKWETHLTQSLDRKQLSFATMTHLSSIQGALQAISALVNDNGHSLQIRIPPMRTAAISIISVCYSLMFAILVFRYEHFRNYTLCFQKSTLKFISNTIMRCRQIGLFLCWR